VRILTEISAIEALVQEQNLLLLGTAALEASLPELTDSKQQLGVILTFDSDIFVAGL